MTLAYAVVLGDAHIVCWTHIDEQSERELILFLLEHQTFNHLES